MTVIIGNGNGMTEKKPEGSAKTSPKAVETEKPATTTKKRGAKKEK